MFRVVGFLIFFQLLSVKAATLEIPHYFSSGRTGLYAQTLGATCYSFNLNSDSIPCNPAYMALERKRQFRANFFGGNNVSYIQDVVDITKGNTTRESVRALFSDRSISELQVMFGAAYLANNFSFELDPYAVNFYSRIRNPALPEITLFGSYDESARMQLATYAREDLFMGVQLRYLHRQAVASRFFLTDALAEGQEKLFKPQDQKYIFIEPGLLYSPLGNPWRPELTFNMVNVGIRQGDRNMASPTPEFHFGAAISPDVGLGRWGWGLDANANNNIESYEQIFTLGSYYEIGILRILGSIASESRGAGFNVCFRNINLGMSYLVKSEKIDDTEKLSTQHLYFLLGAEI